MQLEETWRYQRWETSPEVPFDDAISTPGDLILRGTQGYTWAEVDDGTMFETDLSGDFACVKLSGSTGAVL